MAPTDRLWSSDERVVRISTVKRTDGALRRHSLTGYLVADELVLTCAHDVADAESREVCRPEADPVPAELLWPGPEEASVDLDLVDVALLRAPGLKAPKGRVVWGEYTDYVGAKAARCIGFPRAEREKGGHHAALIDGGFVPGQGSGKGRMQFDVHAPDAVDQRLWAGLSGAMILDRQALLGVLAERSGTRKRRFNAVPASVILEQDRLRRLLGDPELLPLSDPHPLVRSPFEPLGEATEFKLITARYGQVPFVQESHGDALATLAAWCLEDQPETAAGCDVALRLVTGPAGAGKTRLAAELCRRVAEEDPTWRAGFALDDPNAPWGSHLPQTPLLAVFDYVERSAVTAKVIDFLKHLERLGERLRFPVRVLLISRAAGGWYDQLSDQGGTLLQQRLRAETSPRIELRRGDFGPGQRAAHFRSAYARFTAELDDPADPERFGDLVEGEQYDSPLLVHIAALLAAKGETLPSPDRSGLRDRLLGFLLQRERDRRWAAEPALSTTNVGAAESDQALHAVAIMTLTGPTVPEAAEFLKASDLWIDQSNAARREAAKALARLYPAEDGRTAPIEPDLVSEHLVAAIEDLPAVTASLHKMPLGTDHFARMLHLLTLTHDHYPDAVAAVKEMLVHALTRIVGGEDQTLSIAEVLDQSLPRLLEIAVKQVERGEDAEVANLLSSALKQVSDLERIAEVVADTDLAGHDDARLSELGQTLYDIKVRHCRERGDTAGLVSALEGSARALLMKVRTVDASVFLTEALRLRVQHGWFANSEWAFEAVQHVQVLLKEEGLFDESVSMAEVALDTLLAAGVDQREAYEPGLSTLESAVRKARREYRLDEALRRLDYTVSLRRKLGSEDRADFLPAIGEYEKIAGSGRGEFRFESLRASMEALRLRRRIWDTDGAAYMRNLYRIDQVFAANKRVEPDLVLEVAQLLEWLAGEDPGFRTEAAEELEVCGARLWWIGRADEALSVLEKAVQMRRGGAATGIEHEVGLGRSLVEYGLALWLKGEKSLALPILEKADAEMRTAAQLVPELWVETVYAIEYYAAALWESGRQQLAIRLMAEAESIERDRERFKQAKQPSLGDSRSGCFGADRLSAVQAGMEPALKVQLLRMVAEESPSAYSTLANTLEELGQKHAVAGELELVLEAVSEAAEIRRKLADASLKVHGPKLLESLASMVSTLRALKRNDEAALVYDEITDLSLKLRQHGFDPGPLPNGTWRTPRNSRGSS
ncbi:serine protease [Glycomyces sp. NPDC021274]|uniref:S1 family peptidase n=1 Tax=Glycomyces sp. NPDC021274 TaxID=3155120 RepID=UPI0033E20981